MLDDRGDTAFMVSDWDRVLMIHYPADPTELGRVVPFDLDLFQGRTYVSVVMFTIRRLRPRGGGRLFEFLSNPVSEHRFVNVRTYVRHRGEAGIYFLAEWLDNPLAARLEPGLYGLPYRRGRLCQQHRPAAGEIYGTVETADHLNRFDYGYHGPPVTGFAPAEPGTLAHFVMERYTCFTCRQRHFGRAPVVRRFRVWHEPWLRAELPVAVHDDSLLHLTGGWFDSAGEPTADYSPGVRDVWMGPPRRVLP